MPPPISELIDQALLAEDYEQLQRAVSTVSDWSAISQETVDYVLKRIGMYGCSGRTNRYEDLAELIIDKAGSPSLFTCALLEFNKQAIKMLEDNPDLVGSIDASGSSALHKAAERGNLELAAMLCERGADVNLLNQDFETPVHLAAHAGPWKSHASLDMIELLLSYGATKDLHSLAVVGNCNAIRDLFDQGSIEVNQVDRARRTPLFHAAHNNHLPVVRLLLEMGANPNLTDRDGQSPLSTACLHMLSQECDPKIIECLLAYGATKTLESAVVVQDLALIDKFVRREPSRLTGQDHLSPLGYAIHVWRPKSLYRLLELGARPDEANWGHIARIAKDANLVDELRAVAKQQI